MSTPPPRSRLGALGLILGLMGCGPRGCLGSLVGVIAVAAIGAALLWGLRAIFDPWSLPLPDRPSLLGEWTGTLRTASGLHLGLALRLDYHSSSGRGGRTRGANIEGRAQICNHRGERFDYNVDGDTDTWDGRLSHVGLGSVDRSVNGSAWGFRAVWEGDRLMLSGLNSFELDERPTGGRPSLAVVDPIVAELRRAPYGDLDRICAELAVEGRPQ
jgi:hypothetical protein